MKEFFLLNIPFISRFVHHLVKRIFSRAHDHKEDQQTAYDYRKPQFGIQITKPVGDINKKYSSDQHWK